MRIPRQNPFSAFLLPVSTREISKHDTVIENGPGTGNLTKELMKKNPKDLLVVEKDERLSNLFVSMLNKIDIKTESFSDSTRKLSTSIL